MIHVHQLAIRDMSLWQMEKKADEILPRNDSVFSMEVEVPRLLGTEFTWADMGRKRNR